VVHIGIDVHKRESQICWLDGDTGEVRQQRIQTRRDRFEAVLRDDVPAEVLIEAGTESEWVATCLETVGLRVRVVDPGYAPMYPARRQRRHKNDSRDAEALALAGLRQTYREVHRVSAPRQRVRQVLTVREAVVRTRTRLISLVRALLRSQGLRVPPGAAESFVARVRRLDVPADLGDTLGPVLTLLAQLEPQLLLLDRHVLRLVAEDAAVRRLQTAPRVGVVTSAAFVAALDSPTRFPSATQVASYLGLAPKDDSTGDRHYAGRISKAGSTRVRYLLVQASWGILRGSETKDLALRRWAEGIEARRGAGVAVVALARRLARILYAMWRDGRDFERVTVAAAA